jgi:hypothetical protein
MVLIKPLTIRALGLLARAIETTINATSTAAPAEPPIIRVFLFLSIRVPPLIIAEAVKKL